MTPFTSSANFFHAEAEALQQRAERRRGAEAAAVFGQAAVAFQAALQLAPSISSAPERIADCCFGLAETSQNWGEALLATCAGLPDAQLTAAAETQASAQAMQLFETAVAHYRRVNDDQAAGMRADAACNCGNTLAVWAETMAAVGGSVDAASGLLDQAQECYAQALAKEEDASVSGNT